MSAQKKQEGSKIYTIPLRKVFNQPKTRRVNQAVKIIKEFLERHEKREVKLDNSLMQTIWAKGREKPPREVKVKVSEQEGLLKASLAG